MWSGIPISLRIFQFIVIHTVKGFGIVSKAEIDVFLELSCFFHDPVDVGNLTSGSSAFSKTSLDISIVLYLWIIVLFVSVCLFLNSSGSLFIDSYIFSIPIATSIFVTSEWLWLWSQPLCLWQYTHSIYDITSTIYDITSTVYEVTHSIFRASHPLCRPTHPLYLCRHPNCVNNITPTECMTSHSVYE